jgi:membrane glycosyltransferase
MAVPMDDSVIPNRVSKFDGGDPVVSPGIPRHQGADVIESFGAVPREDPLEMPIQNLGVAPLVKFGRPSLRTICAQLVTFGGTLAGAVVGYHQMRLVFGNEVPTILQGMLLGLFTLTFAWICMSALQAIAGLLFGPRRPQIDRREALHHRTAIIMPVYNESPSATCGTLFAMGEAVAAAGHGDAFEIFILSDTRDPEHWLNETAAYSELRERLKGRMRVWYRRRDRNTARKSGNLQDFVERWGGRYDAMLVLDADSLMSADTIIEMARRMQAAPRLGILQTVPALIDGETLFARLQQFASGMYGPTVARGVAAWQGLDGNYWGHNALIRVRAFAENCGLPVLRGRKPFGGHVLSHDFVEAALIRRGGWEVRMDPDLKGSWEESPPSLLDVAVRDRRWAQGNLQHSKIVGAKGLRGPNRMHFLIGIFSYLMSPIWLAMILVGMLLTAQTLILEPQYFANEMQLFPNWPIFDAVRMGWLFFFAMALLLLPKTMALLTTLFSTNRRRAFGGGLRLVASTIVEIILSALYAPILMLLQARQVWEILWGRDSGWNAQSREGEMISWLEAAARHWHHVLAGIVPALVLLWLAPDQFIWLSPVLLGLLLAPLLSRFSADRRIGRGLAKAGLLQTPEEREHPPIMLRAAEAAEEFEGAVGHTLAELASNGRLRSAHIATLSRIPKADAGVNLDALTAAAKIEAAGTPDEALQWLTPREKEALVGSPQLLTSLAKLA